MQKFSICYVFFEYPASISFKQQIDTVEDWNKGLERGITSVSRTLSIYSANSFGLRFSLFFQ